MVIITDLRCDLCMMLPRLYSNSERNVLQIKSGWLQNVTHCPSPHYDARPTEEVSVLVVHNISLPPGQFGGKHVQTFFQGKLDKAAHPFFAEIADMRVSAHCLIERDGQVTQFVDFNKRAWHAGVSRFQGRQRCNDFSIGVELEGTDLQPYSTAQYQSLIKLAQTLMVQYPNITLSRIVGHNDIAPGRKTDPGQAFHWGYFRHELNNYNQREV